jgi:hypothetical protein
MIIFVENSYALVILKLNHQLRENATLFIVFDRLVFVGAKEIIPKNRSVFVSAFAIRCLKVIIGLLQFQMVQPDLLGFAYKINKTKSIISDGLLTEIIIDKCAIKPKYFYTLETQKKVKIETVEKTIIIGSNWVEFGSMSSENYMLHLQFLRNRYPEAIYFRHPRETGSEPEFVFGKLQVDQPTLPIELHCLKNGIPRKIIGVCSTSLLSMPSLAPGCVDVDQIILENNFYDGPKGSNIFTKKNKNKNESEVIINVKNINEFLSMKLKIVSRKYRKVMQT